MQPDAPLCIPCPRCLGDPEEQLGRLFCDSDDCQDGMVVIEGDALELEDLDE